MGGFQYYGPLLAMRYTTAPGIYGFRNGTPFLETSQMFSILPLPLKEDSSDVPCKPTGS